MSVIFDPVDVESFEGCATVGIHLQFSADTAQPEIFEKLWEKFIPLVGATPTIPKSQHPVMFGISFMISPTEFTYWATQEQPKDSVIPAGMESIDIPAGLYARLEVPCVEAMREAFVEIFTHWLPQQTEYEYDPTRCSFEQYDGRYTILGVFDLYIPVVKATV